MEESRDREIVRNLERGKLEMTFWERVFGTHGRCASLEDGNETERLMATTGFAFRDPAPEAVATLNIKFRNPGTDILRSDGTDPHERGIREEQMKRTRENCVDQSFIGAARIEKFGKGNGDGKSASPVSRIG